MARGRSRKRGGRGRRQKNEVAAEVNVGEEGVGVNLVGDEGGVGVNVNAEGGGPDMSVNPPQSQPFDLSLVKMEVIDDDEDPGFVSVRDIKQEPVERGSGARLVDMLVSNHLIYSYVI